jgi:DNA-directed RNA polymerase subunit RPC12/RpoP
MPANKMGPPCPECGSQLTDVSTTERADDRSFWRSRKCVTCGHRFHTVQQPEQYAIKGTVTWHCEGTKRKPMINWRFYEAR